MNNSHDIASFIKDPSLLIELCRKVIDQLDIGDDREKMAAMEVQLNEIATTIDRLEKMHVTVPDVLRAEKTRLVPELGAKSQVEQTLRHFAEDLSAISNELNAKLGRGGDNITARKPRERTFTSTRNRQGDPSRTHHE